jgi:hypothetical protein
LPFLAQGDIVLLSIRDFEPDKADLLEKYTAAEARELQKKGWLSEVGALAVYVCAIIPWMPSCPCVVMSVWRCVLSPCVTEQLGLMRALQLVVRLAAMRARRPQMLGSSSM